MSSIVPLRGPRLCPVQVHHSASIGMFVIIEVCKIVTQARKMARMHAATDTTAAVAGHQASQLCEQLDSNPAACLDTTSGATAAEKELKAFWGTLPQQQRSRIMRVGRKDIFQRIRELYCSRCYGAFQIRYEELKRCETPSVHQKDQKHTPYQHLILRLSSHAKSCYVPDLALLSKVVK